MTTIPKMEIVNAHVHMIEVDGLIKKHPDIELSADIAIFKNIKDTLALTNPEVLFGQLDEAGITHAVLFACDAPIVYASNEYVAGLCRSCPGRLTGFASVDPRREDAAEVIEHAKTELGLEGIKLHPPLQNFYPNDPKVFPLYEKAVELNMPIVFHVGTTPFGSLARLDQANPILLDEVACAFPDLRIMLTHLGTLWHNETFMLAEKNPNMFVDTSAYLYEIPKLLTMEVIQRVGEDKFVFGTDYPMPFGDQTHRMKDFVDCIMSLDLSDEIKKKIFSENFEVFLKGREKRSVKVQELVSAIAGEERG